ncbi:hypothetical protein BD560DRAFT_467037 [Blakeslea trispora]|nr:hypothetical protein BD560DRAFT_467037 [Blakeslea trispora]
MRLSELMSFQQCSILDTDIPSVDSGLEVQRKENSQEAFKLQVDFNLKIKEYQAATFFFFGTKLDPHHTCQAKVAVKSQAEKKSLPKNLKSEFSLSRVWGALKTMLTVDDHRTLVKHSM